ncbi:transient receptor potential cation channel subfamily M member 6-like isoform X1 [Labeo rohita]|uniref:non-specific serine/threonine protein kinase n=1 Tax=Labeo rohita TaxID=84645 RepID=A0A498NJM1_LABRO|nr:transient receptor potential cation channel subfamily M member 6-like isoform X1 [Labeo rohita]
MVICCCGRLIAEHVGPYSGLLGHGPGPDSAEEEEWSVLRHTSSSPTDAFGWLDFQGSTKRTCHAKYVRLSSNTSPELLVQLMLREWHMEMPKLVISVHGGTDNFPLSPRVCQAFSTGLVTAAESTGAWILTDGINTGVSKYVGDAVKVYGSYDRRKRNVVGITPWGIIENNSDLIGRDVFRHYQALGNPLSKRASLNGMHSHFLLVDDGTVGKSGCQIGLRKWLERHIHLQKIHPRLPPHVPLVCVVVEGGPAVLSVVLDYVCRSSPVPVLVFEGTGRAADLLALIHKQTAVDRKLDSDIKEDVLLRIEETFGVERPEASELLNVLMECMEHRDLISIFDSESEDLQEADVAILTTSLRGTRGSPEEQLNITLAWDRADVAKDNIFVYGQQWQVGSLEQTMLDALVMDRVSFVKLLIENGMTMNRFLTVSRLEQLYNIHKGFSDCFLRHLIEDAKQTRLPAVYRMSLIDIGMVIEYLIGGAYRSTYTRKSFRTMYSRFHNPAKEGAVAPQDVKSTQSPEFVCTFNDLFVWAVLKHRQEMAMFLWQHGEQAMARAVVACKLYRAMAMEAKESNMGDTMAEELKKNSLEFGQLAVDLLDQAFKKNERMAMKMLTWEMKDWSNFTCLQMAVSSRLRPFVAHNCTQMLLTDLWMGRLNMSKNSWFKMAFLGFLMMFSYTVLVRLDEKPNIQECLVITYILTMAAEKAREVWVLEPRKFTMKLKVWFSEYWNINDFMGIILFLVGVSLRWHQETRLASHIVYSLDFIFWSVRLLDLFAVNQHAGPYLTMITKMMSNMFYIVVIMAIVLVSFGTSRKSILSPNEEPSWSLLRDVVFQPYWMMFGEVYAGEIDELLLAPDDLKKLHEFEEKCVAGYFRDKKESQQGSEINRIRSAADKAEEMAGILVEVAEKINIIQDNMRTLDSHLGELQDLSALAVDTLNVLSATDNQQQEVARLGQSRNEQVSHSCCLRIGGSVGPSHALPSPKHYRSMPPSLLRGLGPGRQRPSLELPPGTSAGSFEVRSKGMLESPQEEDGSFRWTLQRSDSREGVCHRSLPHLCTRLRDKGMYGSGEPSRASSPTMPLMRDFQLQPSHEESMEEEDDEDAMSRSSSRMFLLTDSHSDEDRPAGIRNPAFYRLDDAGHFTRPQRLLGQKWAFDLEQSRSLSASVETMAMPDTPTSEHGKHTLLMPPHHSHDQRGLSKIFKRQRSFGKKSIKTRTGTPENNTVTPGQPLLSSWARPVSQRPSVSSMTQEAMERNNLMRLAHSIPFTPLSLMGGVEVCIYSLEEAKEGSSFGDQSSSISTWIQHGRTAVLQPLAHQEVLDGGLRRATKVVCTWSEGDVLKLGSVYVVKAFRPEVVRIWQKVFPISTSLHLCLREIQQQRAAQNLMQRFNKIKPSSVHYSPRFLDVSLLHWRSDGQWLTVEKNMSGHFRKYNNNTGEEISPSSGLEETILAFSHWTYEYTNRELLVLDLQGVGADLTDPSLIRVDDTSSSGEMAFGPANLGDDAIQSFVLKHTCNSCCKKLGLSGEWQRSQIRPHGIPPRFQLEK